MLTLCSRLILLCIDTSMLAIGGWCYYSLCVRLLDSNSEKTRSDLSLILGRRSVCRILAFPTSSIWRASHPVRQQVCRPILCEVASWVKLYGSLLDSWLVAFEASLLIRRPSYDMDSLHNIQAILVVVNDYRLRLQLLTTQHRESWRVPVVFDVISLRSNGFEDIDYKGDYFNVCMCRCPVNG